MVSNIGTAAWGSGGYIEIPIPGGYIEIYILEGIFMYICVFIYFILYIWRVYLYIIFYI